MGHQEPWWHFASINSFVPCSHPARWICMFQRKGTSQSCRNSAKVLVSAFDLVSPVLSTLFSLSLSWLLIGIYYKFFSLVRVSAGDPGSGGMLPWAFWTLDFEFYIKLGKVLPYEWEVWEAQCQETSWLWVIGTFYEHVGQSPLRGSCGILGLWGQGAVCLSLKPCLSVTQILQRESTAATSRAFWTPCFVSQRVQT